LFSSAAGSAITLDGANPSLAAIAFNSGSNGYTIAQGTGGTLYLDNGGNSASIAISSGSQAISAPVGLNSSLVITPAAGTSLSLSGPISGSGTSLTMNGNGSLVLSGSNSYSGGTIVDAGELVVTNSSALPFASLTVAAGATLVLDSTAGGNGVPAQPAAASLPDANAAQLAGSSAIGAPSALPPSAGAPKLRSANAAATRFPTVASAVSAAAYDRVFEAGLPPASAQDGKWSWAATVPPNTQNAILQDDLAPSIWDQVLARFGPVPHP
jgi:autotransporter-associated beta strand protein